MIEFFGLSIQYWQFFSTVGILLIIGEVFAPGFILAPIGVAALVTGMFSLMGINLLWLFIIFGINLLIIFLLVNKFFPKGVMGRTYKTSIDGMIGKEGVVEEDISPELNTGYIKIYGDSWRALSVNKDFIEKGSRVVVKEVDGNKMIVDKVN